MKLVEMGQIQSQASCVAGGPDYVPGSESAALPIRILVHAHVQSEMFHDMFPVAFGVCVKLFKACATITNNTQGADTDTKTETEGSRNTNATWESLVKLVCSELAGIGLALNDGMSAAIGLARADGLVQCLNSLFSTGEESDKDDSVVVAAAVEVAGNFKINIIKIGAVQATECAIQALLDLQPCLAACVKGCNKNDRQDMREQCTEIRSGCVATALAILGQPKYVTFKSS